MREYSRPPAASNAPATPKYRRPRVPQIPDLPRSPLHDPYLRPKTPPAEKRAGPRLLPCVAPHGGGWGRFTASGGSTQPIGSICASRLRVCSLIRVGSFWGRKWHSGHLLNGGGNGRRHLRLGAAVTVEAPLLTVLVCIFFFILLA